MIASPEIAPTTLPAIVAADTSPDPASESEVGTGPSPPAVLEPIPLPPLVWVSSGLMVLVDDVTLEDSDVDVWNTEPVTIDAEACDVLELVLAPPLAAEKSTPSIEVNECEEEEELVKAEDERVELDKPLSEGKTGPADKGVEVIGA